MSRKNLCSMKELISGYRRANRKRNWILISTIALTVFVIFSVFSIAKGKITADTLRNIRSNGTCADGKIKNGTQKQYDALKKLSYVEIVGRQNSFAYVYQDEVEVAACVLLDNNAYRKLKEPAIDEMKGTFPSSENEVMMSTACLESMKITNPKVGIKIPLTYVYKDWSIDGGKENQKTFVLSGFYQDYSEENGTTPEIVFSEAYRTNHHLSWDGADLLIKLNSGVYDGRTLEDKLYSDVEIDTELNQQIIVEDSARYAAVEEFVGGFGIAVISVMVLLISAYLMISNVLAAGLTKEIRQYGLLKSIGATQKQVHHISRMQSLYISFIGIGIAIVLCVLFGITLLPTLIGKLYMQGTGTVDGNALLSPEILILSIFAVMIMMKVADRKTAKLLRTITPLQAYHYTDIEVKKKDGNPKNQMRKEAVLFQMAKRNVFRSRKKFVITVVSLFLGIEVALCSVVIGTGINKIHEIRQNPDFVIETKEKAVEQYLYDIIYDPVFYNGGNGDTKPLFSEDFYKQLVSNGAVNQDSIETVRGSYTSINSEEASINVYFNTRTDRGKGEADTLQIISESYIHQLEKYVNGNGLKIDIDNFKKGEGVIMLHRHALAPYQEEKADELVGEPIHLYLAEDTADSQSNPAEVLNCGYLDVTEKAFPKLDTTWMENGDCYFIVSEAGFKKIDILEQKFKLSFDAKEGKESALKKQLLDMIARENQKGKLDTYKLTCNSDLLSSERDYISATRIIMTAISAILIFIGLVNYSYTIMSSIVARKKELAIIRSIGMTGTQMRQMFIYEGLIYGGVVLGFVLTLGNGLMIGLAYSVKKNLDYFKFVYPSIALAIIVAVLFIVCMMIPCLLSRQVKKESAVEGLRQESD